MSNKPNPRASGARTVTRARSGGRSPSLALWVLIGVLALAVVAVLVAAVLTKEDQVAGQQQPVTVTGEPLVALPADGDDPAIGTEAPLLEGHTFDGAPVTVGGESDGPTLVAFVAHWCPHCRREIPRIVDWVADGTIPADVRLVAVATSTSETQPNYPPQDWLEREDWPGDVMADSKDDEALAAYGVTGFPFLVALNPDGTVAGRDSGELDQQGIEDLLATLDSSDAS